MKHKSKVYTSKLTSKTWSTFFGFGKRAGDNPPIHVKPATTRQHPIDASTHDRTTNTTGKDTGASSTRIDTEHTRKRLILRPTRKAKQFVAFGLLLLASALTAPVSAQRINGVDICDRSDEVRRAILEITSNTDFLFDTEADNVCGPINSNNSVARLAAIIALNLSNRGITSLKSGDFDDLTGLTTLRLQGNPITTPLPTDLFDPIPGATIEIDLAPFGDLADIPLLLTGNTTPLDVSGAFISKDADGNDRTLSFSATSDNPAVATVSLTGGVGTITGIAMGTTNINIVADDGTGGTTGMHTRTISVTVEMGVCDRTIEVENAILAVIPGTPACADVTVAELAAITSLDLSGTSITGTLSPRDFAGLSTLATLNLGSTSLMTLPSGVFSALTTSLTSLDLSSNSLTELSAGLFNDLTSLTTLSLQGNTFTTRLPTDLFDPVSGATIEIDVAPIGDLTGVALSVSGTATINVANAFISRNNTGADRTLSYTLAPANTAIATATETSGVVTITGAGAGTTTVSVTADDDGGADTRADATQMITVTVETGMDICDRTPQVESAILNAIPGSPACDAVTAAQLAAITSLDLTFVGISRLLSGDFAGLSGLTLLNLRSNAALSALPADLFSGLTSLTTLDLVGNTALSTLPAGLFSGLTSLTTLSLGNNSNLATLPAGLFSGLTSLTTLNLNGGRNIVTRAPGLTSLPATIFNPLTNLETLGINGNTLSTLDAGLFTGLTSLTILDVSGNELSTLPATIFSTLANLQILRLGEQGVPFTIPATLFSTLTNLQVLDLSANRIRTLDATVFSALTNLQVLNLDNNILIALPDGLFTGLSRLSALSFTRENTFTTPLPADIFDPLPNDATIEIDIAPIGDVADVMLFTDGETPIDVSGTFISRDGFGVDRTLSFSATSDNTAVATVTMTLTGGVGTITAGNTAGMATVTITANNGLPDPVGAFSPRSTSTRTIAVTVVPDVTVDICDRTPEIEAAILAAIPGTPDCMDVTEGQLAAITGTLALNDMSISALLPGDFAGLTGITVLNLSGNMLTTLPDNTLSDLTSLTGLNLSGNDLSTLSAGTFTGLGSLTALNLSGNDLTTLPANVFSDLSMLTVLNLRGNAITRLPANAFSGLSVLTTLDLRDSTLSTSTSLSAGTFTGLDALTELNLRATSLMTLPADLFDPLSTLATLSLQDNNLATLPDDIFESLSALATLNLNNNSLSALPSSLSDLTTLTILNLNNNGLGTLQADVFSSLTALTSLNLANTGLSALPDDLFDGLTSLATLRLHANTFTTPLPANLFDPLPGTAVIQIDLSPIGDLADISSLTVGTTTTINIASAFISRDAMGDDRDLSFTITLTGTSVSSATESGGVVTITASDTITGMTNVNIVADDDNGGANADFTRTVAVTVADVTVDICSRTDEVETAILAAIPADPACTAVTATQLATIGSIRSRGISTLQSDDFAGLSALTTLDLLNNAISTLPAGVFDDLMSLTSLNLGSNTLTALESNAFSALTSLTTLNLRSNGLRTLPADVFDDLTSLTSLDLSLNTLLTALPENLFSGLGSLSTLRLQNNTFTTPLPANLFDPLPTGATIEIDLTPIGDLPDIALTVSGTTTINAANAFISRDNSGNDRTLSYTLAPADSAVATAMESGGVVTITGAGMGTTTVSVTADDDSGGSRANVARNIAVTVVATGILVFNEATGDTLATPIAAENGGTDTFYVQLASAPARDVVMSVTSSNTNEGTVSLGTLTFTTSDWDTRQLITVTAVDDNIDRDDTFMVDFAVTTGDGGNYTTSLDLSSVTVTVTDDDTAGIALFDAATGTDAPSITTTEGTATDSFYVALTSQPTGTVTVTISGLMATEHTLTDPASGTLTFTTSDWDTRQEIMLTGVDDSVVDGEQTYDITLTPTGGGYDSVTAPTVSITNSDDDTVAISIADMSVDENAGTATLTVTLTPAITAGDVMVDATTTDGTATIAGGDYTALTSQTLTFTAGSTSETLDITINDDSIVEGDETFTVMLDNLMPPTGVTTVSITNATATVTITDDDTAGLAIDIGDGVTTSEGSATPDTFTVVLDSQPTADVTVTITGLRAGEHTLAPSTTLTFTTTDWSAAQTVTLNSVDDNVVDGDQTYDLTLTASGGDYTGVAAQTVSVTNEDDDTAEISIADMSVNEDAGTATVTVTLTPAVTATGDVTVNAMTVDDTAEAGTDYTAITSQTLTFAAGSTSETLDITINDDSDAEGDETFTVMLDTLVQPTGVTTVSITNATATVTIIDNDVPGLRVDIGNGVSTSEGSTTSDTFSVVLNIQPTDTVTVTISGLRATEHTFTTPASSILTFTTTNWSTAQTVTLSSVDDNVVDGDQTYDLTLTPAGGDYAGVAAQTVSVTNEDDDTAEISIADMMVNEDAGTATVTVTLSAMVTAGDVTVNATTANGTATAGEDYTAITSQTLTFTAGSTSETLDIAISGDNIAEGNETFTVMLDTLVQPTGVTTVSITDATAEVTITDDETAPTTIDLGVSPSTIAETADATEIIVTATLGDGSASLPTDTEVTLTISGTATINTDYTLTMPSSTITITSSTITIAALATSATKTFMIDPIDDSTTEGEETVIIGGTATINAMTAMANLATLTITESSDEDQQAIEQTVAAQASGITQVVTEQIGIRLVSRVPTSSGSGGSTQDRQSLSSIDWQDRLAKFTYEGLKHLDSEADMSLDWLLRAAGGNGQVVMPLGAESLTLWATGGRISTKGDGVADYDGDVKSFILGIDTAFSNDWVAGVAISYNDSEVDYTMDGTPEAKTEQSLYGIHPYLSYTLSNSLTLWGTAGYGFGDVDFSHTDRGQAESDITQWMAAGGLEQQIITNTPWQGALRIKGLWGNAEVDATTYDRIDRPINKVDTDFWRARMESEMGYNFSLPGGNVRPYAIIGGRWDHNDAIVSGDEWHVDVGGGVEVIRPAFALNISVRTQVTDGDTEEDSIFATGSLTYDLEQDGQGLQIALSRSLDNTSPAWDSHSFSPLTDTVSGLSAAPLTSELAYGWTVHPFGLKGALQTYVQNSFDNDDRHYAVGLELAVNALTLNFETGYHTNLDNETRGSGLESLFKTKIRW